MDGMQIFRLDNMCGPCGLTALGATLSPAPKFQRSTSLALFLQPNELALDPRRVRKLRREPLAASIPKRRAFDGPDGGTG
jgi:hypothetical protein